MGAVGNRGGGWERTRSVVRLVMHLVAVRPAVGQPNSRLAVCRVSCWSRGSMGMVDKPRVLVDPYPRRMEEIFSPADLVRLHDTVEVVWAHDQQMAGGAAGRALREAIAVVCSGWAYGGALGEARRLQAIIDVGGGFPSTLDYEFCFTRRIRVLTCAPAFAPQVAEMALGLALAASRDIVAGGPAPGAGVEGGGHARDAGPVLFFGEQRGLIRVGALSAAL